MNETRRHWRLALVIAGVLLWAVLGAMACRQDITYPEAYPGPDSVVGAAGYVGKVHGDGPSKLVVESGGEVEVQSGGILDLQEGSLVYMLGDQSSAGTLRVNALVVTTTVTGTVGFVGDLTGDVTGNVTGDVTGDLSGAEAYLTGNIVADTGVFTTSVTGDLTGDVTGNVTGDVTGNVMGNVTGDLTGAEAYLTGNIVADTGVFTTSVTGDLTGNVTGDVTGDLTGNVTGDVTGDLSGAEAYLTGNIVADTGVFTTSVTAPSFVGPSAFSGDVTVSAEATGGNALAVNQFIGVPRIKLVGIGTMANGTTNTDITDYGDSETPATDWTASSAAVVLSNDSTYYRQGTASLKAAIGTAATVGEGFTNTLASGNPDWTDDESFGFWFMSDTTLDAGDITFEIYDATAAGGFTAVNLPAYATANVWVWTELDVTLSNNNLKDVITDLAFTLSAAGETKASAAAFNCYFDFMVKWDVDEEESLGVAALTDGVCSLVVIDASDAGATTVTLTEYTDYFVHYQSGDDAVVIISDQSDTDKVGLALVAY